MSSKRFSPRTCHRDRESRLNSIALWVLRFSRFVSVGHALLKSVPYSIQTGRKRMRRPHLTEPPGTSVIHTVVRHTGPSDTPNLSCHAPSIRASFCMRAVLGPRASRAEQKCYKLPVNEVSRLCACMNERGEVSSVFDGIELLAMVYRMTQILATARVSSVQA
eukprot:110876-Amphidinium_carterae.1